MLVSRVTEHDIRAAAKTALVVLLGLHHLPYANENTPRTRWRFRLVPGPEYFDPMLKEVTRSWQRYSASPFTTRAGKRRRVHAVCWHGHRAFMRALYALAPSARIVTAFTTYNGAAEFEAKHEATAGQQTGPSIARVAFAELCACGYGRDVITPTTPYGAGRL